MKMKHIFLIRKSLILVLVFFVVSVAYSYYRRSGNQVRKVGTDKILTADVARATEKIEFTENRGGKELFKVVAQKHLENIKGKNILEQVKAINYSREGNRSDTIESDHCEYDPASNTVVFNGHVVVNVNGGMQISSDLLTYDKTTETANSPQTFNLKGRGLEGRGIGLHYNFSKRDFSVDRNGDFIVHTNSGTEGSPVRMQSDASTYDHARRVLQLHGNVSITQANSILKSLRASIHFTDAEKLDHIEAVEKASYATQTKDTLSELKGNGIRVDLSKDTAGIQRVEAKGSATFGAKTPTAGNHLSAENIVVQFSGNQPSRIAAEKNVLLTSLGSTTKFELSGEGFLASFGKQGSTILEHINIQNNARLKSMESDSSLNELLAKQISLYFMDANGNLKELDALGKVMWSFPAPAGSTGAQTGTRILKCQRMKMLYQADGKNPDRLQAQEECHLEVLSQTNARRKERRIINGDRMEVVFHASSNQMDKFNVENKVKVTTVPLDANEAPSVSRSDFMKAEFDKEGQPRIYEQTGNFQYLAGTRKATSQRAVQEESTGLIHLTGKPAIWDESTRTVADGMTIDQQKNLLLAKGHVRTIHKNGTGSAVPTPFASNSREPILINSEALEMNDKEGTAIYRGRPRASQEGNFVQAEQIELLNKVQEFRAQNNVHSLFYVKEEGKDRAGEAPSPATIKSQRMTYYQSSNMARYEQNASLRINETAISSKVMDLYLSKEDNKIERADFEKEVRFKQPDREGSGTHAEFYANEDKTVLVGNLAQINSKTKGMSMGKRLTFYNNGDKIFIDSR